MKFLTILFFSNITLTFSLINVMQMSVDLVNSYERATTVTAFLCWKIHKKADFLRRLGNLKHPHSVKFVNKWKKVTEIHAKDVFVADLSCPGIDEFLIKVNSSNMFSSPYRWLIFDSQREDNNSIPLKLEAMNIPINSEVVVAQEKANGVFEMHLIYKIHAKGDWFTEYYGVWASLSGLKKYNFVMTTSMFSRRKDMKGESLTVTFNVNEMYTGLRSTKYDNQIRNSDYSVTKWGYQMIVPLFDFLNATRVNLFSTGWGYFVNGSWNGMVGEIVRGEAELAGTPIFVARNRMEHLAYLMDPVQTSVVFVFREPPLSYQNNLFLLPFNKAVWYSLAGFLVLMMIVIYIIALWENKTTNGLDKGHNNSEPWNTKMNVSDVALMIVGAITQQGSFVELRGSIGRLVMFTLLLSFLFLFTAYSASIVALLQSSSKQIRTLSDLLYSKLELGVENTTYNQHYFTTATDPIRKAIYETKIAPQGTHKAKFMSVEDGVKKLQKHPFAFNMDVGNGYAYVEKYFLEHEKCGLREIAYIPRSKPWVTCKKISPYAELFKFGYLRMREHGMCDRANSLVYAKKPMCAVNGGSFDSVSIVDVYPALLVLLYGSLLACALLGVEILARRRLLKRARDPTTLDKEAGEYQPPNGGLNIREDVFYASSPAN